MTHGTVYKIQYAHRVYIGSTTMPLRKRFQMHKNQYNYHIRGNQCFYSTCFEIFDNSRFHNQNPDCLRLWDGEVANVEQLRIKEQEFMTQYKNNDAFYVVNQRNEYGLSRKTMDDYAEKYRDLVNVPVTCDACNKQMKKMYLRQHKRNHCHPPPPQPIQVDEQEFNEALNRLHAIA